MTKRILITGVAGHLGSKLAEWILAHKPDCHIIGIDNLSSGYRENVPCGVEFVAGSVGHAVTFYPSVFVEPFDAVFHFAAFAAECLSPFVRLYTIRNVWEPTAALINALVNDGGCGRLVFASSIAAYGPGEPPFEESAYCRPNDPYGIAKLACEHDIRVAGEQHGLDWCILRPHNIYGPGQNLWDAHRNVFGLWMRAAIEGRPFTIFGDGEQRRAFSYIDDILPCIWAAAFAPQCSREVINLGGARPMSIANAATVLSSVVGTGAICREPARHEVKDAWCDNAKSEQLMGFRDETDLRTGLSAMWTWAQEAWEAFPYRRQSIGPEIEVARGMPPAWAKSKPPALHPCP